MSESEVTYIPLLREGNEEAARKLWDDHFSALVRFARKRLVGVPRGDFDEEDAASCALHTFCQGMAVNDRSMAFCRITGSVRSANAKGGGTESGTAHGGRG